MKRISQEELEVVKRIDPLAGLVWQRWIDTGDAILEIPDSRR